VVRVPLVCVADTCAQRMVAELLCVCGRLSLRVKGTAYVLATGQFEHIVYNRCALGAALGAGFDVYIRHIGSSVISCATTLA
jgi:hypothetical protein